MCSRREGNLRGTYCGGCQEGNEPRQDNSTVFSAQVQVEFARGRVPQNPPQAPERPPSKRIPELIHTKAHSGRRTELSAAFAHMLRQKWAKLAMRRLRASMAVLDAGQRRCAAHCAAVLVTGTKPTADPISRSYPTFLTVDRRGLKSSATSNENRLKPVAL